MPIMKNIFKLIIGLIVLLALGYGIWWWSHRGPTTPPPEFLEARQQGAAISQKIVALIGETNQNIKDINTSDLNGNYNQAVALIKESQGKNQEAQNQAVELANQMQKMTEALDKISSASSRELAMKAIATEISLLTNLMQYKETLDQFLKNLNLTFATAKAQYRKAAEDNLSQLNTAAGTINNLNQQFLEQIQEFDKSL